MTSTVTLSCIDVAMLENKKPFSSEHMGFGETAAHQPTQCHLIHPLNVMMYVNILQMCFRNVSKYAFLYSLVA